LSWVLELTSIQTIANHNHNQKDKACRNNYTSGSCMHFGMKELFPSFGLSLLSSLISHYKKVNSYHCLYFENENSQAQKIINLSLCQSVNDKFNWKIQSTFLFCLFCFILLWHFLMCSLSLTVFFIRPKIPHIKSDSCFVSLHNYLLKC
jgi:hypothetical protein